MRRTAAILSQAIGWQSPLGHEYQMIDDEREPDASKAEGKRVTASFYDVATEMDVPAVSREPILQNLKCGAYKICSPFFNCDSDGHTSATGAALVRHISGQLERMRKARSSFARRTA